MSIRNSIRNFLGAAGGTHGFSAGTQLVQGLGTSHLEVAKPMEAFMSKRNSIRNFFGSVGSAVRVSRAVDAGIRPQDSDLMALGINPADFHAIRPVR